jgi:hypothetical protein
VHGHCTLWKKTVAGTFKDETIATRYVDTPPLCLLHGQRLYQEVAIGLLITAWEELEKLRGSIRFFTKLQNYPTSAAGNYRAKGPHCQRLAYHLQHSMAHVSAPSFQTSMECITGRFAGFFTGQPVLEDCCSLCRNSCCRTHVLSPPISQRLKQACTNNVLFSPGHLTSAAQDT